MNTSALSLASSLQWLIDMAMDPKVLLWLAINGVWIVAVLRTAKRDTRRLK